MGSIPPRLPVDISQRPEEIELGTIFHVGPNDEIRFYLGSWPPPENKRRVGGPEWRVDRAMAGVGCALLAAGAFGVLLMVLVVLLTR